MESTFRSAIGFPLFNQVLGIDPNDAANQIWLNESQATDTIDDLIFKLNASYQFADDFLGYFTFSQGYRNGNTNGIIDCAQIPAPNPNVVCGTPDQLLYQPDTTDNYELSVRSQWLDQSLTLNAALYYIQWNDVQVATTSFSGGFPIVVNGNAAESSGIEIDLNWQITDNLLMRSGYSFTAAKLAEEAPLLADGNAGKGDRLPGSPEHQGSLFFDLNLPINSAVEFFGSYGFTAQSDVFTDIGAGSSCCRVEGAESLSGFTIHYLTVGLRGEQWEASLFADNLLDEQAVTGVRPPGGRTFIGRAGGAADYALRRYFNYVITPRVVGLDLRYRF